jgi:riboflavin transporter FmnP
MQKTVFYSQRLHNRSVKIAGSALLGAMAFLLQMFVKFPFPLLPWLVFDFSEIPTVVAFLLFGPIWGMLSSVLLFLIMVMRGSSFPPGPYMKLIAIVSMQVGIWLGFRLAGRFGATSMKSVFASGLATGLISRALVMTPVNYLVVGVFFASDFYFKTAEKSLRIVGITLASQDQFIILMLVLSAVYNVLHVFLSVVPTIAITRVTPVVRQSWLMENLKTKIQKI